MRKIRKRSFIKVYNSLLQEYKLTPPALKVYLYLSGVLFWMNRIQIRYEAIANRCGMSINTARKAIEELEQKKLISKTACFGKHNKREANEYTVCRLSGGFAMLDKNLIKPQKDYNILSVLCSVLIRSNHANRSFPSIAQICRDTGLCRTTVIAKLKHLHEHGLLQKEHHVNLEGDYGHNNYKVVSTSERFLLFLLLLNEAQASAKTTVLFMAFLPCRLRRKLIKAIKSAVFTFGGLIISLIHRLFGIGLKTNTS